MKTLQKPLKRSDFTIEKYLHICADMAGHPDVDMTIDNVRITIAPTKAELTSQEATKRLFELVTEFKNTPHVVTPINNGKGAKVIINGYLTDETAADQGLTRCDFSALIAYADIDFYKEHQIEIDFLLSGSLWLGATLNCGDEFLTDLSPVNWILEQWWHTGSLSGNFDDITQDLQRYV